MRSADVTELPEKIRLERAPALEASRPAAPSRLLLLPGLAKWCSNLVEPAPGQSVAWRCRVALLRQVGQPSPRATGRLDAAQQ